MRLPFALPGCWNFKPRCDAAIGAVETDETYFGAHEKNPNINMRGAEHVAEGIKANFGSHFIREGRAACSGLTYAMLRGNLNPE